MVALAVTDLTRVKTALGIGNTENDQLLNGLIQEVSAQVENFIGTPLLQTSRTEYHDFEHRRATWFRTNVRPVTSISSIKIRGSITTSWSNASTVDSDDYELADDGESGKVHIAFSPYAGNATLQIIYTGGFASNTSNLLTNYPEIVSASERQITWLYQRRHDLGGATTSIQGGSVTAPPAQLLKSVRETLWKFRASGEGGGGVF